MASPHRDQHHADRPASCRTVVLFIGCSVTAFVLLALMLAAGVGPVLRLDAWISHAAHIAALAHPHWRQAMATITMSGGTAVLTPGGGTGLGLPIARENVLAHGGTLTVDELSGGAVMRIRIPLPGR